MVPTEALAKFMARLADAARELAEELQAPPEMTPPDQESAVPSGLGSRQQEAYEAILAGPEEGLTTGEITKAMDYDFSNGYMTLRRLEQLALVELIPGSKPQRWRLPARHRANAGPYLLAAQQISEGEWATYGDISIAVRGDDKGARAVGRAAATLANFPNPQRVLKAGGVIPSDWHDGAGRGAEECQRRLEKEGVRFREGRADPARRVTWELLRERLRQAGVSVPPDAE